MSVGDVDLYHSTYRHFGTDALAAVRRETYDEDIGQNSWLSAAELRGFIEWMGVTTESRVLEVACGSGGPACYVVQQTGCYLTGVDANPQGVANARAHAAGLGLGEKTTFIEADANRRLPFDDASFDTLLCVDALNHLQDRRAVLSEWLRVLSPGGRLTFTDPVVVTGAVSNSELARRASIGFFLFVAPGYNERLLAEVGFRILRISDGSSAAADVSARWRAARARLRSEIVAIEGEERFERLQDFLQIVHDLTDSGRLSRLIYHALRPA
jgi:SAM-dependent methyltransferase